MLRSTCLLFFLPLLLAAASNPAHRLPLRLAAEFVPEMLEDTQYEPFVQTLERSIDEYGLGELMIGFRTDRWLTYADFPKVRRTVDTQRLAAFRNQLKRFKRRGVRITLAGAGPLLPDHFFEAYPDARRVGSGLFAKFLETSTAEVFRQVPEADRIEVYLWETPLLNDASYFTGLHWAESAEASNLIVDQYYGPADYIRDVVMAYARGAQAAGKEFQLLTFSHYPWQERLLIEALRQIDHGVPILLDHKGQPGDWSPYRPANNVMLSVPDRKAQQLFDGTGEYWGWSLIPYCYPEEIQQRLQHALKNNPNIEALGMRVTWTAGHTLFGTFNEVNWYALSQLAKDPDTPIEEIWKGWAEKRFGKEAAPKVISALERTNEIGNLTYYIHGVWIHNHSAFSDLPYLESHFVHYIRSSIEWNPAEFRMNALLTELTDHPREHTIEWVIADRMEALRLNALSLADVESVKTSLPAAEYDKLKYQLTLQRRFIEASIPHIEAFLRYRIEKVYPSAENRARLDAALRALEEQAAQVQATYREQVPILTAAAMRRYVAQLRDAVRALQPGPLHN